MENYALILVSLGFYVGMQGFIFNIDLPWYGLVILSSVNFLNIAVSVFVYKTTRY